MKGLLRKELKLAVSPLSWLFLAASLMTLLPGYPILVGAFLVCQGLFQSFLNAREANDVLYTVLLPVRKGDFVRAKYAVVAFFEALAFAIMAILTAVRMTAMAGLAPYAQNALMNANLVYLMFVLLIFALFNAVFVGGFFRTAYNTGRPFIIFLILAFALIIVAEALHHIPGLGFLNDGLDGDMAAQWIALAVGAAAWLVVTTLSCRASVRRFESIDL